MKYRPHQAIHYRRALTLLGMILFSCTLVRPQPKDLSAASPQMGNPNDVTVLTKPQDFQLYQRNPTSGKATVTLSGSVDGASNYSQILVRAERNQESWDSKSQMLDYGAGDAPFQIKFEIVAERADYDFTIIAIDPQGEDILLTVTDVVAGDIFLINGQSNANAQSRVPTDRVNGTVAGDVRKYIRSYGSREDTGNETDNDMVWHEANGDSNWGAGAIGQWGMRLGQRIVEEQNTPVAILNGAVSGTRIFQHMRNNADPDDLDTIYGRLLWRAQSANIANDIRAFFWYQGEADQQKGVNYTTEFGTLYAGWKTDYPNLEEIYVFQIRNTETTCGPADIVLREEQRRLADTYADVNLMSTTAIDQQVDGCHFPFTGGYREVADHAYGLIARDFYAGTTHNVQAPNIDYAYFSNNERTEVTVAMRSQDDTLVWGSGTGSAGPHLDFQLEGSGVPAVTAGVASGNRLTLTLDGDGSSATAISYLGHSGDLRVGEWVTNLNGIGLLAFHNAPLGLPPTIALDAPTHGAVFASGTNVELRVTASDADGDINSVAFFLDGQLLGDGVSSSGDSWQYVWTDATPGTYTITATATDDDSIVTNSAPATVRVNAPPLVALTQPMDAAVAHIDQPLSIRATASDGDGQVTRVDFYVGAELLGTATTEPWEISWTPTASGIVQLTAVASDNDLSSANSVPSSIRVNALPTVQITAPAGGASFDLGAPIEIAVAASDSDGSVREVRFYAGTMLLHVDDQAPWVYTWQNAALGTYQLTAAAVDNDGGVSTLAGQVGITVLDAAATPTNTPTPTITPAITPTVTSTPSGIPSLSIVGESTGAPGSRFVLAGHDFAANAAYKILIGGAQLETVQSESSGAFAVELVTSGAMLPGEYTLSIVEEPTAATQFVLDANAVVRQASSGNRQIAIPLQDGDRRIYLPEVWR